MDRFVGLSGRLQGTITTLTPFFIPDKRLIGPNDARPFLENANREALMPGSSLKGLCRSVVETVSGGAWWFAPESVRLPSAFRPPRNLKELDAACRMFGFLQGGTALLGRVMFSDGICTQPQAHDAIYTCILSSPKPRHTPWYEDQQGRPAGRKFYFHSDPEHLQTARGWLPPNADVQRRQNQYIKPLAVGNVFTFEAQFTNLEQDDFALLLYALVLEPTMRHKFGYAKPAGLGSVHVQLDTLDVIDYTRRYRGGGGRTRYERAGPDGDTLTPYVAAQIAPFTSNQTSPTLQDLRRIWQWPPVYELRYPSQQWFNDNPQAPISETP
jgi:CRISPR-associated protein (TIGR03986 family)